MKRTGGGSLYKRGAIWWCKWYRNGRPHRESTGQAIEREAKAFLARRMGAVAEGRPILPRAERVGLFELLDDLATEYAVNARASARRLGESLKRLRAGLGKVRALDVDTAMVNRYIAVRQKDGVANATINRELAALSRAYTLAVQGHKLAARPYIPRLVENNVRSGFFEREQLAAVLGRLPRAEQAVVSFGAITGWRLRECLTLTWAQVDFSAGMVRLEPGTTKNGDGRMFPLTPGLRDLLDRQRIDTERLALSSKRIIPLVFHRSGRPIRTFYGAWRRACREAGCPGRLFHDLRRTAVRTLERTGVPRSVAMRMTGHKTEAVYRRYAIVSESDLRDAAVKLAADAAMGTITGTVIAFHTARLKSAAR